MSTVPFWTDTGTEVVSPVALGRGECRRGTIDLRAKYGAYLLLGIGRGGTAVLTNGVNVEVRRTINNNGRLFPGAPHFAALTTTTAAYAQTLSSAAEANGTNRTVTLGGTGTPTADEDICFWGTTTVQPNGTSLPNLEFARVSKYASPTLTLDAPFKVNKINGELVTNQANLWSVWCPGGCVYEVIFDYGDDTAGDTVAVVCYAQVFDAIGKAT